MAGALERPEKYINDELQEKYGTKHVMHRHEGGKSLTRAQKARPNTPRRVPDTVEKWWSRKTGGARVRKARATDAVHSVDVLQGDTGAGGPRGTSDAGAHFTEWLAAAAWVTDRAQDGASPGRGARVCG